MKRQLIERYDISDMMGEVRYVLGVGVSRNIEKGKLLISQGKYDRATLEIYGMLDRNVTNLPGSGTKLSINQPGSELLLEGDMIHRY